MASGIGDWPDQTGSSVAKIWSILDVGARRSRRGILSLRYHPSLLSTLVLVRITLSTETVPSKDLADYSEPKIVIAITLGE